MIRSNVVTFEFISSRPVGRWLHDYCDQPCADIADDIDKLSAWACWAVPSLEAEPLIQLRSKGP